MDQHEFLAHCAHKLVFAEWLLSLRWGAHKHAGDLLSAIQDAVKGSGNAASSDPVRVAHLIEGAWQAGWLKPGSFEAWHVVAKTRLSFPGGMTNHRAGQLMNAKREKDAKGQPIGDVLCYCWTLAEGIPGSVAVRWAQEVTP